MSGCPLARPTDTLSRPHQMHAETQRKHPQERPCSLLYSTVAGGGASERAALKSNVQGFPLALVRVLVVPSVASLLT